MENNFEPKLYIQLYLSVKYMRTQKISLSKTHFENTIGKVRKYINPRKYEK